VATCEYCGSEYNRKCGNQRYCNDLHCKRARKNARQRRYEHGSVRDVPFVLSECWARLIVSLVESCPEHNGKCHNCTVSWFCWKEIS